MLDRVIRFSCVAAVAFAGAFSVHAETDETWGEAWNTASVVGLANMTIDSNQNWRGHTEDGVRGSATELFDNNPTLNQHDYLHSVSMGMPTWVKLVIKDSCQEGKDFVLKKYRLENNSAARAPKTWRIYGAADATLTAADTNRMTRLQAKTVEPASSVTIDMSSNVLAYRTYFIFFDANGGDGLLQVKELYLFGEIKDHEEEIRYAQSEPYSGLYDGHVHSLVVTPMYPAGAEVEYSSDGQTWGAQAPSYKEVGEYTIYYRVTADGLAAKTGEVTISIQEPPRENLDIVATVKAFDKNLFSAVVSSALGSVVAGGINALFNQEVTTRVIVRSNPVIDVKISNDYRPGDDIIVTNFLFVANSTLTSFSTSKLIKAITISGRNADDEEWSEIYQANPIEWQELVHYDATTKLWSMGLIPERKLSYRQYRFAGWGSGDFQVDELCLLGNIGAKSSAFDYTAKPGYNGYYDGYPHGAEVVVRAPEGATLQYALTPEGPWTEISPTITEPGSLSVYSRISAEGLEDVINTTVITILPAPRKDLDIFATVITADKVAGLAGYFTAASVGTYVGTDMTNLVFGAGAGSKVTLNSRPFQVDFTISDAYRPYEYILPDRLTVALSTNLLINASQMETDMPTNWTFSASTDGTNWMPIVEYRGADWDAPENFSLVGGNTLWSKDFPIQAPVGGWRHYRLTSDKRFALSYLKLHGMIGVPRGMMLIVR